MTKKLYTEAHIENIADAIRAKNGSSDTYKVSEMATAIENITGFEVPADMCLGYSSFRTLPAGITFAARTSLNSMFGNCTSLTTVPLFDTSSVTSTIGMFAGCDALTTVPLFDTSSVTDARAMFSYCTSLTTVPQFDLSSATNISQMFFGCDALTTVPLFDTSSVTTTNEMFCYCYSLTTVPQFDLSSVNSMGGMYSECPSLSNTSLQNILKSLVTATSYLTTKTLKTIGLTSAQATTCTGFDEWVTLSESGWTTGY